MDIIHLFVSDVMTEFLVTDKYQLNKRHIRVQKNFYDIDTYINWAEKKLERIATRHLNIFFPRSASLKRYYETWDRIRHDPSFIQDIRSNLEIVFPFTQRITNPQAIVAKYMDMLETLYDTAREEEEQLKIQSQRDFSFSVKPTRPASPMNEIDEDPILLNERNVEEVSEENVEYPQEIKEEQPRGQEKELKEIEDENPTVQTEKFEESYQPQMSMPEPVEAAQEEESSCSENASTYEKETKGRRRRTLETRNGEPSFVKCRELGIKVNLKDDCDKLLEQYAAETISFDKISKKGIYMLIKKKFPASKVSSVADRYDMLAEYRRLLKSK